MAAPALRRTVGRLAAGGYMPAECGECALDVAVVQRAFSGHRAPFVVPDEVWTQFSANVEVDSLHRWLTANNAGQRSFNMMLAAGHAILVAVRRRRALASACSSIVTLHHMRARPVGRPSHLCSLLTHVRDTCATASALVFETLSTVVIVECFLPCFKCYTVRISPARLVPFQGRGFTQGVRIRSREYVHRVLSA